MIKFTLRERKEKSTLVSEKFHLIIGPITNQISTRYQYQSLEEILTGILAGPLPSVSLVTAAVGLVGVCNLGNERIVGVRVSQHGADRQEHLGDCKSWRPLIPQDIQANAAVAVDVGVVDSGCEVDL